jgi:hypothetical protein
MLSNSTVFSSAIFLVLLVKSSYAVKCYRCREYNQNAGPDWGGKCYSPTKDTDETDCEYCYVHIVRNVNASGILIQGNILS